VIFPKIHNDTMADTQTELVLVEHDSGADTVDVQVMDLRTNRTTCNVRLGCMHDCCRLLSNKET